MANENLNEQNPGRPGGGSSCGEVVSIGLIEM